MADSVKTIVVRYLTQFGEAEKGFTKLAGQTQELNRQTQSYNASVKDTVKQLKAAAKQGQIEAFDTSGLEEIRDGLRQIKRESRGLSNLGALFSVDPKVRRQARDQVKILQDYETSIEAALQRINELKAATSRLTTVEEVHTAAIRNKDRQMTFAAAHAKAAMTEIIDGLNEESGGWEALTSEILTNEGGLRKQGGALETAGRQAASFGGKMDVLTARLRQIVPVLRGAVAVLVTALVPAIIALAGAAAAAGTALVGMAGAAVNAAIPAFTVFAGFMSRLSAVMDAVKKQQQAVTAAQRDGKGPTSQLAAANEALRGAHQRAADAAEAIVDAEHALADAQRAAREEIRTSIQAREDAYVSLQDAIRDVADAEVEGLEAIRDAAEEARDAILDLEQAQLDLDEASLNRREAIQALKELRNEADLTGGTFDTLFEKFTDVSIDFDSGAFRQALKKAGISETSDEAFDLERAVLRVRNAELQRKQAIDGVDDAQQQANETQKEANRLAREGLAGYRPYTDAVRALGEAQRAYTEQARETARIQRAGVGGNEGVIQAQEALEDAQRSAVDANRALRRQEILTSEARRGMTAEAKAAAEAMKELSASERGLARRLFAAKDAMLSFIRQGTDPMMDAMSEAVDQVTALGDSFTGKLKLATLAGALRQVGQAFGRVITRFAEFATSGEGVEIFAQGARLARRMLDVLSGGLMQNAMRLIGNLGRAFGPGMVSVIRLIARGFKSIADSTSGLGPGDKRIKSINNTLRQVLRFVGAVADAIVAFGVAASDAGGGFIKWLREGLEHFTEFIRSAEGKESIKQFFKEAIPFVKSITKTVIKLGTAFLQAFEFFAPALTSLADGVNIVLDVFNFLADLLNELPGPIKEIISLFIPIGGQIRGGFLAARIGVKAFSVGLGTVIAALTVIGGIGRDAVRGIVNAFNWLVDKVKSILGIGSPSTVFAEIGKDIIRGLWQGLKAMARLLFNAGKFLVQRLIRGVRAVLGLIDKVGDWIRDRLAAGFRAVFEWIFKAGKFIVERWIRGIKAVAHLILEVGKWIVRKAAEGIRALADFLIRIGGRVAGWIINGIKDLATEIYDLGKQLIIGLANGIKDAAGEAVDAVKGVGEDIISEVGGVFGIGSPSRVFATIGRQLVQGLVVGLREEQPTAQRAINDLFGSLATDADMPGLAAGGIVTSPTVRRLGEAGREAVIPLKKAVLRDIGAAVAGSMRVPMTPLAQTQLAGAGPLGSGIHIDKIELPPPPEGGIPDARYQAAQLAAELRRRGGR